MTEILKKHFNDCEANVITLESQSVIVTSDITGDKDSFTDGDQGTNGLISDTKSL